MQIPLLARSVSKSLPEAKRKALKRAKAKDATAQDDFWLWVCNGQKLTPEHEQIINSRLQEPPANP